MGFDRDLAGPLASLATLRRVDSTFAEADGDVLKAGLKARLFEFVFEFVFVLFAAAAAEDVEYLYDSSCSWTCCCCCCCCCCSGEGLGS